MTIPLPTKHVEADPGGLDTQFAVESGHVSRRGGRAQRLDLRAPHLRCARLLAADEVAGKIRGAKAERSECRRPDKGLRGRTGGSAPRDQCDCATGKDRLDGAAKLH